MTERKATSTKCSKQAEHLAFAADAAWDKGDLRQAFTLFMKAARMGHLAGQLNGGYFFDVGLFVKQDKQQAMYWYRKAYSKHDPAAANNIATIYRDLGNTRRMLWWFKRAGAMGDPDALLELGKWYEIGLHVPRDYHRARLCYRGVFKSRYATEDDRRVAEERLTNLRKRSLLESAYARPNAR